MHTHLSPKKMEEKFKALYNSMDGDSRIILGLIGMFLHYRQLKEAPFRRADQARITRLKNKRLGKIDKRLKRQKPTPAPKPLRKSIPKQPHRR